MFAAAAVPLRAEVVLPAGDVVAFLDGLLHWSIVSDADQDQRLAVLRTISSILNKHADGERPCVRYVVSLNTRRTRRPVEGKVAGLLGPIHRQSGFTDRLASTRNCGLDLGKCASVWSLKSC